MNTGGSVEPTAPDASDPAGPAQYPPGYQPVPNSPPSYEVSIQPFSAPQQPGAHAYYYTAGPQPAANPYPTTGIVYGSGQTSCSPVGYIAPCSSRQPVVCSPGYKVEQPTETGNVISQRYQQRKNYSGHIVLAIIVFISCCPVLGFIALITSVVARDKAATNPAGARRDARTSLALSLSGISIAVLIVVIVVSVLCSNYRIAGQCFMHREQSDDSFYCVYIRNGGRGYHKDGYCYSN